MSEGYLQKGRAVLLETNTPLSEQIGEKPDLVGGGRRNGTVINSIENPRMNDITLLLKTYSGIGGTS